MDCNIPKELLCLIANNLDIGAKFDMYNYIIKQNPPKYKKNIISNPIICKFNLSYNENNNSLILFGGCKDIYDVADKFVSQFTNIEILVSFKVQISELIVTSSMKIISLLEPLEGIKIPKYHNLKKLDISIKNVNLFLDNLKKIMKINNVTIRAKKERIIFCKKKNDIHCFCVYYLSNNDIRLDRFFTNNDNKYHYQHMCRTCFGNEYDFINLFYPSNKVILQDARVLEYYKNPEKIEIMVLLYSSGLNNYSNYLNKTKNLKQLSIMNDDYEYTPELVHSLLFEYELETIKLYGRNNSIIQTFSPNLKNVTLTCFSINTSVFENLNSVEFRSCKFDQNSICIPSTVKKIILYNVLSKTTFKLPNKLEYLELDKIEYQENIIDYVDTCVLKIDHMNNHKIIKINKIILNYHYGNIDIGNYTNCSNFTINSLIPMGTILIDSFILKLKLSGFVDTLKISCHPFPDISFDVQNNIFPKINLLIVDYTIVVPDKIKNITNIIIYKNLFY